MISEELDDTRQNGCGELLDRDINVTARVWCRGGIDRKGNSTINLTTDSGACY